MHQSACKESNTVAYIFFFFCEQEEQKDTKVGITRNKHLEHQISSEEYVITEIKIKSYADPFWKGDQWIKHNTKAYNENTHQHYVE